MPKVQSLVYRTPKQNWVAGSSLPFHGWVPVKGPRGGRVVIDGFEVVAEMPDITQAATAIEGEEAWRMMKRVRIEQAGGIVRWNLTGDESRVAAYMFEGAERVREHADIAVAANQNLTFSFYLPLTKRFAKYGTDFAMPADLFSQLVVECADLTELSVGGGTTTITSGRYYVVAHCHEESPGEISIHVDDEVASTPFQSTSGVTVKAGGRLHDLAIFARGASGGASMANLTDVRIDGLMPLALTRNPELLQPYLRDRYTVENLASTDGSEVRNDPFSVDRAVPVLYTSEDTSPFDGDISDQVIIYTTNTVASCIAIHRTVKPINENVAKAVAARYGLKPRDFRVKTAGKSKRNPGQWQGREDHLAYMPLKAHKPG